MPEVTGPRGNRDDRTDRRMSDIRVSLVLATVERVEEPMYLVESLAGQIEQRFELIVVDQNPDERLAPLIARARAAGVAVLHLRQAVPNLALARNTGIEAARGEWIGFPDDDCWYEPETLSALVRASRSQAHGYVGSWLEMDDPMRPARRRLDSQKWAHMSLRGESAPSICLFLSRPLLIELGGFDERLGVGQWYGAGEETDIVMRALAAGARLEYAPAIVIHHLAPDALPPMDRASLRASRLRGRGGGALFARHRVPVWRWLRTVVTPPLMLAANNPQRFAGFVHGLAIALGRFEGFLAWRIREGARPGPLVAFAVNTVSGYRWGTLAALAEEVGRVAVFVARPPQRGAAVAAGKVMVSTYAASAINGELPGGGERTGDWAWGLAGLIWRERPTILVASEFGSRTAIGWLMRRIRLVDRLVIHADLSDTAEAGRGWPVRLRQRLLAAGADAVVVNGASGERHMRRIGSGARVLRIPYATETAFLAHRRAPGGSPAAMPARTDGAKAAATPPLRLVFVGQFVHGKRIAELIGMLEGLLADLPGAPQVELNLVGQGPLQEQFEALAQGSHGRKMGLAVNILGPVGHDALPALLATHDVLALPSAFETWGMVVNEAMAVGLPVLGSRQVQAVEEMVRDGREGWVFDAGDADSERRAIIAMLGTTPLRRARMGRLARASAGRLSETAVASRWCALVREMSAQTPASDEPSGNPRLREQIE